MENYDIIFINPPFANFNFPYISIPTLSSYLKNKGFTVAALDFNQQFVHDFLSPANISFGKEFGIKRFNELNQKQSLSYYEAFEYKNVCEVLNKVEMYKDVYDMFFMPFFDFEDIKKLGKGNINFLIQLASVPYFPQIFITQPDFEFFTTYDPFCSDSIYKASSENSYYTEQFKRKLQMYFEKNNSKIVGFSVIYKSQVIPAFQCARLLKELIPDIHITFGGSFISIFFSELKTKELFSIVDSFIFFEGEIPLEKLILEISKPKCDFSAVPGLMYLSENEIKKNELPGPISIEDSPCPDYNVFSLDDYIFSKYSLHVPFRLTRGCSWGKCSFCRTDLPFVTNVQETSCDYIFDELKKLIDSTGIYRYIFSDECAPPEFLEKISLRLIKENIKIKWSTHTRVDKRLTHERCLIYKEAGCHQMALGVESLNDRILRLMKKGINEKLIEDVLYEIKGTVNILAYMILGFPTESEKEAIENFRKICYYKESGLIKNFRYSLLDIPYKSDLYNNPQKYGITNIVTLPEEDLLPDIFNFESSGMSRDKAFGLLIQFNKKSKDFISLEKPYITVEDKKYFLNYNMNNIHSKLQENWKILYESPEKWLSPEFQLSEPIQPIKEIFAISNDI
jgi:anaerobic magnesium-protoporphyrin IX monomethyl ester cyclase